MCHKEKLLKDCLDFCFNMCDECSYFEDQLFSGSSHITLKKKKKKGVWNNRPDLCNWDFVTCTICTQNQRGPKPLCSPPERIRRSICLLFGLVPVVLFHDLNWCCEWSVRLFNVKDFFSHWSVFKMICFWSQSETETSLLPRGSVINSYVCVFVMTNKWEPSLTHWLVITDNNN